MPELEDKLVTSVERLPDGFRLRLDDGETIQARKVVLAVGITHFELCSREFGASAAGVSFAQLPSS